MKITGLLCDINSSIENVMNCINRNTKGLAFIIKEQKLVGVMSDGDVRRLLLDGYGLKAQIQTHVNSDFVYASDLIEAQEILSRDGWKYRIIPIVDSDMHVVDYAEYNNNNKHIALAQPQLEGNEYKYLMEAFLSTWISSTGKYVSMFEERFSAYCGVKYGVATSNGTTALHLALTALGIGKGDEVIVPDITFAATINAVIYTGATPVIVDIEEKSWCIDPEKIEEAITKNTKAIIPVHIYGQICDMERICSIADKCGLYIVEDCAEAHGAEFAGKKAGSFGKISCFSFFGNKVITTGEGGMCVTDDKELEDRMRILRDHGMSKERRYYHEVIGFNYRMTNMQAAIGVGQLERIDEILQWRSDLEERYREEINHTPGIIVQENNLPNRKKITWLVSILVSEEKRDDIIQLMKQRGIDVRAFFIPLSEMDIYKEYAKECFVSKKISKRGINLPTTSDISSDKIQYIISVIKEKIQ